MAYPLQTATYCGRRFTFRVNAVVNGLAGAPLIVALHGGGYTSAYFDIGGFSLLALGERLRMPVIAVDRPGYGASEVVDPVDVSHAGNAAVIDGAIASLWTERSAGCPGIVLIGHSIGGAIALQIAARRPTWPLLGVAVSGVGLRNATGDLEMWQSLPNLPLIELPSTIKDTKMFGAPNTYDSETPARSHAADAPAPRAELIDIVTAWPRDAAEVLARVAVPVHYRQADGDALWLVSTGEVAAFGAACTTSPMVDAAIVAPAGHCIDFHHLGHAFQLEQLAFALRWGVLAGLSNQPSARPASAGTVRA